jgi:hypothetical protein
VLYFYKVFIILLLNWYSNKKLLLFISLSKLYVLQLYRVSKYVFPLCSTQIIFVCNIIKLYEIYWHCRQIKKSMSAPSWKQQIKQMAQSSSEPFLRNFNAEKLPKIRIIISLLPNFKRGNSISCSCKTSIFINNFS